jgi:hypothetical protein
MLNFCVIVAAILKMETGRNFSMSGINSGHWNRTMLNLCGIVVAFFLCQESIRDIIFYPHMKWRWNRTMLNLCCIVVAILKMATGIIFSMSGHHYLPTYQILMISDNVEFLWRPFWKWWPVEIFRWRESIWDIIIYPHIKFWWYRTMLNFYRPFFMPCFGSHFENGRHLENFENAELLL